ncbi:Peptidase_C39 like family protein [Nocardioides sp. YR527]|uniref:C39 family peptidase n=1 Tax=Nocardioides sp. YR527 TaxID=1881028 RepID=UPI0008907F59|nr:C39 family peptidase [Nocardioides sp. YR527]SDL25590.1 Peptidase_C39 like family protein [Nocardioides sp. YR527]
MSTDVLWTGWSGEQIDPKANAWVSPEVSPGFCFDELVASWNVVTPPGTWVEVAAQVVAESGERSGWLVLARWSSDPAFTSTSVAGQDDPVAVADDDTILGRDGHRFTSFSLRLRSFGSAQMPRASLLGAMVSAGARDSAPAPEAVPRGTVVGGVPAYSQQLHRDRYPQWDGGGQSWCSAASTAMIADFWGVGPTPAETAWVDYETPDPQVPFTVREVYDESFGGAGNWAFNTAYAGTRGLVAYVTRLRSFAEAARFLEAGIPLVLAVSHQDGELTGAGYVTNGHLLVLTGFDEEGDPVVHDPASHRIVSDAEVRATYDVGELDRAWARSGRIVYLIRPPDVASPQPPAQPNW